MLIPAVIGGLVITYCVSRSSEAGNSTAEPTATTAQADNGDFDAKMGAERAVKAQARDPDNVAFRNEFAFGKEGEGRMVCGEFNANNGFGGKAGYERFLWGAPDSADPGLHLKNGSIGMAMVIDGFCAPRS